MVHVKYNQGKSEKLFRRSEKPGCVCSWIMKLEIQIVQLIFILSKPEKGSSGGSFIYFFWTKKHTNPGHLRGASVRAPQWVTPYLFNEFNLFSFVLPFPVLSSQVCVHVIATWPCGLYILLCSSDVCVFLNWMWCTSWLTCRIWGGGARCPPAMYHCGCCVCYTGNVL